MDPSWTMWIALPVLGGLIGYLTNRIAVKMIFRPIEPKNVLGIRIQGLIGKRQKDLAESIGNVVGDHLVKHADIVESFEHVDLEGLLSDVLEKGMAPTVDGLRSMPLIGGFLTPERIGELRSGIVRGILEHKDLVFERLEQAVESGLDVPQLVREKVAAFPVEKLETLVLQVAARELRAIEILGGVLGTIIGILQVVIVTLWA